MAGPAEDLLRTSRGVLRSQLVPSKKVLGWVYQWLGLFCSRLRNGRPHDPRDAVDVAAAEGSEGQIGTHVHPSAQILECLAAEELNAVLALPLAGDAAIPRDALRSYTWHTPRWLAMADETLCHRRPSRSRRCKPVTPRPRACGVSISTFCIACS